jgi:hypothetical protein
MENHSWIASEGGPLICVHRSQLPTWHGVLGHDGTRDGFANDYDRACAVAEEIGVIGSAPQRLVLGDEPDATSVRRIGCTVYLVRWRSAPSPARFEEVFAEQLAGLSFENILRFTTLPGEHVLFDSAGTGLDHGASTLISLEATSYDVASARLTSPDGVDALVHRLRAVEASP